MFFIVVVVVAGVVAVAAAVVTVAVVCCLLFVVLVFVLLVFLLPLLPVQMFSQSCSGRTSSNRWCFHFFLNLSEQKKKRMFFCASETHPTVFTMVLPLVTKITVFSGFFGQCLAKTLVSIGNYLYMQFSACCKKYFFHAKGTKTL